MLLNQKIFFFSPPPPPPFSLRLNPVGGFHTPWPNLAFSPRVKFAESRRGVVGGVGLSSPLTGFYPNTEISFLMISPKLLDICPVFLLVFSPIKTSDLLILLCPSGDGNSLLCSQKSSFCGTVLQIEKFANLEICILQ